MNNYKITVEVDYVVSAESLSEAMLQVEKSTEHPFIGHTFGRYDAERIINGAITKEVI